MRRPVQCEGIERGPQRAARIGVAGSVQPQFSFGDVPGTIGNIAKTALPIIAGAL